MTSPARRRTARRGKAHSLAAACSRRCPDRYWNLASITVYLRSPYASAGSLRQKKKSRPHAKNSKKRRRKEIPQRRFFSAEKNRRCGISFLLRFLEFFACGRDFFFCRSDPALA